MKSRWLPLVAVPLLVVGELAVAQEANAPTSTGETGLFTILTGQTVPKGKWSFGFYYNNWDRLAVSPYSLTGPREDIDLGYDWNRISASVAYGLSDNFEMSLMVPYEDFSGSASGIGGWVMGHPFLEDIDAKGLGNVRVGGKWRFVGSSDSDNELGMNFFVEAPTGDDAEGVVPGDVGFGGGLVWTYKRLSMNLGYHDPGDADEADTSAEAIVALGYRHPFTENFDWITELYGTMYLDEDWGPEEDDIDFTTGGRVFFGEHHRWAFSFGARLNMTLVSEEGLDCPIGGVIGLSYFPRKEKEHKEEAKKEEIVTPPPPPPPPVPTPPPPKAEIREICLFESGVRVNNICKATLDSVALKLKQDATLKATIVGYSDNSGSATSQMKMSKDRAEGVKSYLMSRHGIAASRLTTEGKGAASPAEPNDTPAGRAKNRRVEITLSGE